MFLHLTFANIATETRRNGKENTCGVEDLEIIFSTKRFRGRGSGRTKNVREKFIFYGESQGVLKLKAS